MSTDQIIIEDLPFGAYVRVSADEGTRIFYVDTQLQIRTYTMGKNRYWLPMFLTPNVDEPMMALLEGALRRECPNATELRHVKSHDGFFMYAVAP